MFKEAYRELRGEVIKMRDPAKPEILNILEDKYDSFLKRMGLRKKVKFYKGMHYCWWCHEPTRNKLLCDKCYRIWLMIK